VNDEKNRCQACGIEISAGKKYCARDTNFEELDTNAYGDWWVDPPRED